MMRWRLRALCHSHQRPHRSHPDPAERCGAVAGCQRGAPPGYPQGCYIIQKEKEALKAIIMASGSELQHAMKAADELGDGIRVVSMPTSMHGCLH